MSITGLDVKKAIKRADYTVDEAARILGMSRQNLYGYFTSYVITDDFIENVNNKLNLNLQNVNNEANEPPVKYLKQKGIPYFDVDAAAGRIDTFNDKLEVPTSYIDIPGFEDCNFWINCFGESMYPKYCPGEIIACKEVEKKFVAYGEAFLIRLKDGNRYIKYLRKCTDVKKWLLVSENDKFDAFEVLIDDVANIWIIKGKIKKNMI